MLSLPVSGKGSVQLDKIPFRQLEYKRPAVNQMRRFDMLSLSNPQRRYLRFEREIRSAIEQVFKNGYFILGPETSAFEDEFACYLIVEYAISVGPGTDAFTLALVGTGIKPGD